MNDSCDINTKLLVLVIGMFAFCLLISHCICSKASDGLCNGGEITPSVAYTQNDSLNNVIVREAIRTINIENKERISDCINAINDNMTLWISLICAICTILPIASNLYYSNRMSDVEKDFQKKIDNEMKKLNKDILSAKKDFEDDSKIREVENQIMQISSSIVMLCDFQTMFQTHNALITDPNELKYVLSAIERNLEKIRYCNLGDDKDRHEKIKDMLFILFNRYEVLLTSYETCFEYPRIVELLGIKERISKVVNNYDCMDLSKAQCEVIGISYDCVNLFNKEISDREIPNTRSQARNG